MQKINNKVQIFQKEWSEYSSICLRIKSKQLSLIWMKLSSWINKCLQSKQVISFTPRKTYKQMS